MAKRGVRSGKGLAFLFFHVSLKTYELTCAELLAFIQKNIPLLRMN